MQAKVYISQSAYALLAKKGWTVVTVEGSTGLPVGASVYVGEYFTPGVCSRHGAVMTTGRVILCKVGQLPSYEGQSGSIYTGFKLMVGSQGKLIKLRNIAITPPSFNTIRLNMTQVLTSKDLLRDLMEFEEVTIETDIVMDFIPGSTMMLNFTDMDLPRHSENITLISGTRRRVNILRASEVVMGSGLGFIKVTIGL